MKVELFERCVIFHLIVLGNDWTVEVGDRTTDPPCERVRGFHQYGVVLPAIRPVMANRANVKPEFDFD